MKITLISVTCFLLLLVGTVFLSTGYAEEVVSGKIASELAAEDLAEKAGGKYVKGALNQELTPTQIALPVVDESSGAILGHIVAEQSELAEVLNAAGLAEVSTAVAAFPTAASTGAAAGATATAGVVSGTTVAAAVGVAAVVGVALAVSGGSDSTSNH